MVKRYEELTISDDFMFGKTMGDKVLCRDVLERLLEEKVGELEDVQPQREFRYTSGGKPVRLDMYTRDKKRMYDAEMQNPGKCRRICGGYMIISEPRRSEET